MRAARWLKVSLTISAIGATAPLLAQGVTRQQLKQECNGDTLARRTVNELGAALHRRMPDSTWARMVLAQTAFDFTALGDSVRALWDTLSIGIESGASQRMLRLLERQMRELNRLDSDPAFLRNEGPTARWFQISEGQPGEAWVINESESDGSIGLIADATTLATVRAVCWTALLARKVADFGGQDARAQSRRVLAARAQRWDNFQRLGYSLTPLELLLNGWCGFCRSMLEPPRVQIIAVHVLPTLAVRDSIGNRPALTTEIAGVLFYNSARSFHWGFAYAYALPTEERREPGWVLHVSKIGQLGLTFRNNTYKRENASLLLSADLYRFIEMWSGKLRDERDAVAKGIRKLKGAVN